MEEKHLPPQAMHSDDLSHFSGVQYLGPIKMYFRMLRYAQFYENYKYTDKYQLNSIFTLFFLVHRMFTFYYRISHIHPVAGVFFVMECS